MNINAQLRLSLPPHVQCFSRSRMLLRSVTVFGRFVLRWHRGISSVSQMASIRHMTQKATRVLNPASCRSSYFRPPEHRFAFHTPARRTSNPLPLPHSLIGAEWWPVYRESSRNLLLPSRTHQRHFSVSSPQELEPEQSRPTYPKHIFPNSLVKVGTLIRTFDFFGCDTHSERLVCGRLPFDLLGL